MFNSGPMRRVRLEPIEQAVADYLTRLDLTGTVGMNLGDTDWACGHCDQTLLSRARDCCVEQVAFRCPFCNGFSRYREIQQSGVDAGPR